MNRKNFISYVLKEPHPKVITTSLPLFALHIRESEWMSSVQARDGKNPILQALYPVTAR